MCHKTPGREKTWRLSGVKGPGWARLGRRGLKPGVQWHNQGEDRRQRVRDGEYTCGRRRTPTARPTTNPTGKEPAFCRHQPRHFHARARERAPLSARACRRLPLCYALVDVGRLPCPLCGLCRLRVFPTRTQASSDAHPGIYGPRMFHRHMQHVLSARQPFAVAAAGPR